MGRFDSIVSGLQSVSAELDNVVSKAPAAASEVRAAGEAVGAFAGQAQTTRSEMASLTSEAVKTRGDIAQLSSEAVKTRDEIESAVTQMGSSMQTSVSDAKQKLQEVEQTSTQVGSVMDQINAQIGQTATAADDLRARLEAAAEGGNIWTNSMLAQLDEVEKGEESLTNFLAVWGDAVVQTEDGAQRIRTILSGLSPQGQANPIDQMISRLHQGEQEISELVDRAKQKTDQLTQALLDLFQKLQEGKISLELFLQQTEQAQLQSGPGSEAATLAQELAHAARTQGL